MTVFGILSICKSLQSFLYRGACKLVPMKLVYRQGDINDEGEGTHICCHFPCHSSHINTSTMAHVASPLAPVPSYDITPELAKLLEKCKCSHVDRYRIVWIIKRMENVTIPHAKQRWAFVNCERPGLRVISSNGYACVRKDDLPDLLVRLRDCTDKTGLSITTLTAPTDPSTAKPAAPAVSPPTNPLCGQLDQQIVLHSSDAPLRTIWVTALLSLNKVCPGGYGV